MPLPAIDDRASLCNRLGRSIGLIDDSKRAYISDARRQIHWASEYAKSCVGAVRVS